MMRRRDNAKSLRSSRQNRAFLMKPLGVFGQGKYRVLATVVFVPKSNQTMSAAMSQRNAKFQDIRVLQKHWFSTVIVVIVLFMAAQGIHFHGWITNGAKCKSLCADLHLDTTFQCIHKVSIFLVMGILKVLGPNFGSCIDTIITTKAFWPYPALQVLNTV